MKNKNRKIRKQSFLKGSALLLGMVLITKILGLVYKIPLTRLLGGTGMGYFSAAYSVFTPLLAAVCAGIPSALSRLTAENYAFEMYRNLKRQKLMAHLIFGSLSVLVTGAVILFSGLISQKVIGETGARTALICIAPSVIFCTYMSVERGYYEGLQNMVPTAVSEIVETFFRLVLGLGFAFAVQNFGLKQYETTGKCFGIICKSTEECMQSLLPFVAAAAIAGSTAASLIACIYLFVSGKIHGDGITKTMLKNDRTADRFSYCGKLLVRFSFPAAMVSVITTFTGMIDMLTVNPLITKALEKNPGNFTLFLNSGISAEELPNFMYGSYMGFAVTVYGLVPTFTGMLGKSLLPSFCRDYAKKNLKGAGESLFKMLWLSSAIAIPSGLGISVLSGPILRFLFGSQNLEIAAACRPLSILGLGVIFTSIYLPCLTILQSLGNPSQTVGIMILGGIVKLVMNIVLIPLGNLGLNGCALSTVLSDLFVCIMSLVAVFRLVGGKSDLVGLYVKPLYAGILCVITAVLCMDIFNKQQIVEINSNICLLISIAFGGIIYVFALCLLCEMPKNMINQLLQKKIQKNT